MAAPSPAAPPVNRPGQVLFASLIGTAIEFFDFYIYANATVLVFPRLFFPKSDPAAARLASFDLRRVAGAVSGDLARPELGLHYVGYYVSAAGLLSLLGVAATRETKGEGL